MPLLAMPAMVVISQVLELGLALLQLALAGSSGFVVALPGILSVISLSISGKGVHQLAHVLYLSLESPELLLQRFKMAIFLQH